jgi:hypothetical protein
MTSLIVGHFKPVAQLGDLTAPLGGRWPFHDHFDSLEKDLGSTHEEFQVPFEFSVFTTKPLEFLFRSLWRLAFCTGHPNLAFQLQPALLYGTGFQIERQIHGEFYQSPSK